MSTKEPIFGAVGKMVADFLYYDRKGDEELPLYYIEEAVRTGTVSEDEIVDRFRSELHKGLTE